MNDSDIDFDLLEDTSKTAERDTAEARERILRKAVGGPDHRAEPVRSAREELQRRRNEGGE